jgi:activator of HSP90 ATPase
MSNTIHQEIVFKATPAQVYEALTNAEQFSKVTGDPSIAINAEEGGAISCFGGYVVGRNVELVPNQRIVQAWRASVWEAGVYSIAKFELKEQGSETLLVFDHTGFPEGQEEHLAAGWHEHYWNPLQKFFA